MLARSATQSAGTSAADPLYSRAGGRTPRTVASGPLTARITSSTLISEPSLRASLGFDELCPLQLEEDRLEERGGDVLRLGDAVALDDRRRGDGKLEHGAKRVVLLGRDPHGAPL
jgi:hypothetical protein